MTLSALLKSAAAQLAAAGIQTARLDAMILLEDVLRLNRAQLLVEPERSVSDTDAQKLQKLLSRRAAHEPLSYIRGHSEFYGREFVVGPGVLVPRPESETMIELLKELPLEGKTPRIADLGTGSGALGITAALELPQAVVELIELDDAALQIAKINVEKFTPQLAVVQSDLLANTHQNYDILLANLPYVPDNYPINKAAEHEPKIALFAGADGLDLYRKLFAQLQSQAHKPLYLLLESLPEQHAALAKIAVASHYKLTKTSDFIQLFERN